MWRDTRARNQCKLIGQVRTVTFDLPPSMEPWVACRAAALSGLIRIEFNAWLPQSTRMRRSSCRRWRLVEKLDGVKSARERQVRDALFCMAPNIEGGTAVVR
jgi:hypothetical protein